MLKDKFTYKLTPNEVSVLNIVIDSALTKDTRVKDSSIQLALCVILKVRKRLAVNIIFGKEVKLSFNQSEALAFHILYKNGYIASNFLTSQLFTPIDRVL